jgi:hypothetical protein
MKIIPTSLSRHLVRLQRKSKLTKKEKIYTFLGLCYIFQYVDVLYIHQKHKNTNHQQMHKREFYHQS